MDEQPDYHEKYVDDARLSADQDHAERHDEIAIDIEAVINEQTQQVEQMIRLLIGHPEESEKLSTLITIAQAKRLAELLELATDYAVDGEEPRGV